MASDVTTLPVHGEVFLDARGGDRSMRVSWHYDTEYETNSNGVVVLSLWRSGLCVGSFRMRPAEVAMLIDTLQRGLGTAWPTPAPPPQTGAYAYPEGESNRGGIGN